MQQVEQEVMHGEKQQEDILREGKKMEQGGHAQRGSDA